MSIMNMVPKSPEHESPYWNTSGTARRCSALTCEKSTAYVTLDIKTIYYKVLNEHINMNPQYQRGYVWSMLKQKGFIESIMNNFPIPSIMLSQHDLTSFNMMDGKQRVDALVGFKNDKFNIFVENEHLHFSELSEKLKAEFDAKQLGVTISTSLTEQEESIIFERINRAAPLGCGEKINSYLYSPLAKTRDDFFKAGNPIFDRLSTTLGDDTLGRIKRNDKVADRTGYMAGAGMGVEYITTSFNKLQPMLEMPQEDWDVQIDVMQSNMGRLADIWHSIIVENGIGLRKEWISRSRIWRLGYVNGFILYSFWEEESKDYCFNTWKTFISEASKKGGVFEMWKKAIGTGTLSLTPARLHNGWYQVKHFVEHNAFKSNVMYKKNDNEETEEVIISHSDHKRKERENDNILETELVNI